MQRFLRTLRPLILGTVCVFSAQGQEPPAIVALTLDTSGSIRPELLAQVKDLALGVLQSLPPGSQVALFTFDDKSRRILDRTTDADAVKQALQSVNRAGNYTALYDALYDASGYLKDAPPSRKAIILVTDGLDENSSLQIEDGLRVAVDNKIPVYCVGVGKVQEAVLRRIAKLTNGEYARMADVSPATLASAIQALAIPATPTPRPAVAAHGPGPVAGPAAAQDNTPLYAVAGLLVLAITLLALFALRRKSPTASATVAPGAAGRGASPSVTQSDDGDDGADRTVVMRSPEVGAVERTVMLRVQPSLTVIGGPSQGQVFNLNPETSISIGRAPSNDISINDSAVSGEHCRVRPEGGAFVVHDLKSTNGTFVNEKRVERHRLSEGDEIRVGETSLRFKLSV